jgi:DOMON domain
MSVEAMLFSLALSLNPAALGSAAHREVNAAGVRLQWVIRDQTLHACMEATTRGWVAVGFNTKPTLDGARLVMGRVVNGRVEAQVHIAKPPHHIHRLTPQGAERLSNVMGVHESSKTRICFNMPLAAVDAEDVQLRAEQNTHIVLAWSHESDFDHHSAQRNAVQAKL